MVGYLITGPMASDHLAVRPGVSLSIKMQLGLLEEQFCNDDIHQADTIQHDVFISSRCAHAIIASYSDLISAWLPSPPVHLTMGR